MKILDDMNTRNMLPWRIMGNFNLVLDVEDRLGGNPVCMAEIIDFWACIEGCGLLELSRKGNRYTMIKEMLGRSRS